MEYLEVHLPPVVSPASDGWRQALANFHAAERSYVIGDDAAVFNHLRGAFDALPGAKQHVVDAVTNETKRKALDGPTAMSICAQRDMSLSWLTDVPMLLLTLPMAQASAGCIVMPKSFTKNFMTDGSI